MNLKFETAFDPAHGRAVTVAQHLRRLTAPNASAFTFHGTNSFLLGEDTLAVFDPGPDDETHFHALLAAIDSRPVSHIFVTHTHKDHSPLAARLKAATGAATCAEGPHRPARPLNIGEVNPLDAAADTDFEPDIALDDGEIVHGDGWSVSAIHTPGHAANHCAFAIEGTGQLLTGDHVMAWSTSIVAPPDGSMADYMASLDKLLGREDRVYFPAHGGPVRNPAAFVRGLRGHRRMRERAVIERLRAGDATIGDMVAAIYRDIDPRLKGAAALSVLAHLEDLVARGLVRCDKTPAIDAHYRPA